MPTILPNMASNQVVCNRCWGPVSHQLNMSTNKFEVTPCQQCLSDLERKAVRSAAEDIQAERRNADQQFKEGYKEGFKEGFIKAHDLINS